MKSAAALTLALALFPAAPRAEPPPPDEGFSLMEEGARLLFRGLMAEMEPTINDMQRALDDIGPALDQIGPQLRQLVEMVGDFQNYEAPVRLPNGDILIRRKPAVPAAPLTPAPGPNGEIDL